MSGFWNCETLQGYDMIGMTAYRLGHARDKESCNAHRHVHHLMSSKPECLAKSSAISTVFKPYYSILFRLSIKAIVSHTQINANPTWRFPKVRAPPNHHQLDIIRPFQYWNPWIWGSPIWKNRQISNHFQPTSRIFTIFPPFFYIFLQSVSIFSPFCHPHPPRQAMHDASPSAASVASCGTLVDEMQRTAAAMHRELGSLEVPSGFPQRICRGLHGKPWILGFFSIFFLLVT